MNSIKTLLLSITICLACVIPCCAQGIHFESGLSWAQVQAKAKAEGKYIFVDCYATWCAPCRQMSARIFPAAEVGQYFNNHFISVAVQMDRTAKDSTDVHAWYETADSMGHDFGITAYPTYLFFSPGGRAVHRTVGGVATPAEFVAIGQDALNPERQYYTLADGIQNRRDDAPYLLKGVRSALEARDRLTARKFADAYLECGGVFDSPEVIKLLAHTITSSDDQVSRIFLREVAKINRVTGDPMFVQNSLAQTVGSELIGPKCADVKAVVSWPDMAKGIGEKFPTLGEGFVEREKIEFQNAIRRAIRVRLAGQGAPGLDWDQLEAELAHRFPGYDDLALVLGDERITYLSKQKRRQEVAAAAVRQLQLFGPRLDPRATNGLAWDYIFSVTSDPQALREAIRWMKPVATAEGVDPGYIDTYANVLYKLGEVSEGIAWERKAIVATANSTRPLQDSDLADLKEFVGCLEKMLAGKPTWPAGPGDTNGPVTAK